MRPIIPYLTSLTLLMLLIPSAYAAYDSATLEFYANAYNAGIDSAPSVLKTVIGDERIKADILMNDGSKSSLGFVFTGGRVVETSIKGLENPTITIETKEKTLGDILVSKGPGATFQEAKDKGDFKASATNPFAQLKVSAALSSVALFDYIFGLFTR